MSYVPVVEGCKDQRQGAVPTTSFYLYFIFLSLFPLEIYISLVIDPLYSPRETDQTISDEQTISVVGVSQTSHLLIAIKP